jgi:hypothetical protein
MTWACELTGDAERDLRNLPRDDQRRVARALDRAAVNPFQGDVKALPEVIRRGSPDFIGLRSNVANPLSGGLCEGILVLIVHHLGGSRESVREAANFPNLLFYRRILRGPKWCPASAAQQRRRRRA